VPIDSDISVSPRPEDYECLIDEQFLLQNLPISDLSITSNVFRVISWLEVICLTRHCCMCTDYKVGISSRRFCALFHIIHLIWRSLLKEPHCRRAQVWNALSRDFTVYLHANAFIHEWNKPYLPSPSQPKLVLIYRPRRDGRLSWPRRHHGEQTVWRKTAACQQSQMLAVQDVTNHWATQHCAGLINDSK